MVPWGGSAWLGRRLARRNENFINQLPDVARLLSNGASAGLSMPAAIELAAKEIDAPAREELQGVLDEVHLGRSLDEALDSLARRLPSRELAVLMSTLIIQQRTGGDLVRALQDLSSTLDMRRETLREVRTLMAGAVFTSYVVPMLGLGALLMLNSINSKTLPRMTSSPLGIAALVVAGSMYAARVTGDQAHHKGRSVINPALIGLAAVGLLWGRATRDRVDAHAFGDRTPGAGGGCHRARASARPHEAADRFARRAARFTAVRRHERAAAAVDLQTAGPRRPAGRFEPRGLR